MTDSPDQRLDSWKAIAAYLGRDGRTVRRWEREKGLPVRRVPGGSGHSVFAYASEIDDWLKSSDGPDAPEAAAPGSDPVVVPNLRDARSVGFLVAVGLVIVVSGLLAWGLRSSSAAEERLQVRINTDEIIASAGTGEVRWRYLFPQSEMIALPALVGMDPVVLSGQPPTVLAANSHRIERKSYRALSGQLFTFSPDGALERTFSFSDRWTFNGRTFGDPWGITRFWANDQPGRRRIAVSAHHFQWWPGLVTVLDERGRRGETFVNSGWIEDLRWASPTRLIVSGFSDSRDAGVVVLLDADALNGASPEDPGAFQCDTCGPDRPVRYITLPRSELNRVTASPFNRAHLEVIDDGLIAHTTEVPSTPGGEAIDALYEFSPTLELRRASFGGRYWDLHRQLEAQGKVDHPVDRCPDRDGPRGMQVWEPKTGWRTLPINSRNR